MVERKRPFLRGNEEEGMAAMNRYFETVSKREVKDTPIEICPVCGAKLWVDGYTGSCDVCAWEDGTIDIEPDGTHYSTVNGMTVEKAKEMVRNGLDTLGRPLKK